MIIFYKLNNKLNQLIEYTLHIIHYASHKKNDIISIYFCYASRII